MTSKGSENILTDREAIDKIDDIFNNLGDALASSYEPFEQALFSTCDNHPSWLTKKSSDFRELFEFKYYFFRSEKLENSIAGPRTGGFLAGCIDEWSEVWLDKLQRGCFDQPQKEVCLSSIDQASHFINQFDKDYNSFSAHIVETLSTWKEEEEDSIEDSLYSPDIKGQRRRELDRYWESMYDLEEKSFQIIESTCDYLRDVLSILQEAVENAPVVDRFPLKTSSLEEVTDGVDAPHPASTEKEEASTPPNVEHSIPEASSNLKIVTLQEEELVTSSPPLNQGEAGDDEAEELEEDSHPEEELYPEFDGEESSEGEVIGVFDQEELGELVTDRVDRFLLANEIASVEKMNSLDMETSEQEDIFSDDSGSERTVELDRYSHSIQIDEKSDSYEESEDFDDEENHLPLPLPEPEVEHHDDEHSELNELKTSDEEEESFSDIEEEAADEIQEDESPEDSTEEEIEQESSKEEENELDNKDTSNSPDETSKSIATPPESRKVVLQKDAFRIKDNWVDISFLERFIILTPIVLGAIALIILALVKSLTTYDTSLVDPYVFPFIFVEMLWLVLLPAARGWEVRWESKKRLPSIVHLEHRDEILYLTFIPDDSQTTYTTLKINGEEAWNIQDSPPMEQRKWQNDKMFGYGILLKTLDKKTVLFVAKSDDQAEWEASKLKGISDPDPWEVAQKVYQALLDLSNNAIQENPHHVRRHRR